MAHHGTSWHTDTLGVPSSAKYLAGTEMGIAACFSYASGIAATCTSRKVQVKVTAIRCRSVVDNEAVSSLYFESTKTY